MARARPVRACTTILSGSERVHGGDDPGVFNRPVSLEFGFPRPVSLKAVVRPGRGDGVRETPPARGVPPTVATFDYEKLSAGHAEACDKRDPESRLVSVGVPPRIDDSHRRPGDPRSRTRPAWSARFWLHGDNIAAGYWRKPQQTQKAFGGQLVDPSERHSAGPVASQPATLGTIYDGELFIIGRIKDLLIVDGP